ncbi:MAG: ribosome small subunit-dependent GTPase A [Flavobacteriaceae bacterium]|nr:ribosome small subunit-dependent GTPase A [Flavobacteriaceae bacterium]
MRGQVYKSTGSWYQIKAENGEFYSCRIKGKFRMEGIKSTNPVAVGDWVQFELEAQTDDVSGVIHDIEKRKNVIVRKSVNLSKQQHIIAANIDTVFLLITLNNPETSTVFIDRFLVSTEAFDVNTVLVFNKIDTYDAQELVALQELIAVYEKIGYTCLKLSAKVHSSCQELIALMQNKTTSFAGHSGVGKSTLVNTIEPGLQLKTSEISTQHLQGQHTTTFAQMHDLSFGGSIVDTPGIRGFGLVDIEKEEISSFFPEFFELKADCKFNNCLHVDEPKCAVLEAYASGEIAMSRYKSYLQILQDDEALNYR